MVEHIAQTTAKKLRDLIEENQLQAVMIATQERKLARQEEMINRLVSEGPDGWRRFWARGHCGECGAELPTGGCVACGNAVAVAKEGPPSPERRGGGSHFTS